MKHYKHEKKHRLSEQTRIAFASIGFGMLFNAMMILWFMGVI